MKKPIVFSLVREQSVFMTAIMALLTFLAVLAFGVGLAIGTGVIRWNAQWDNFATVQVMDTTKYNTVKQTLASNADKIVSAQEISTEQMHSLMSPWVSGGATLENYLPKMWEVEFKTKSDLVAVGQQLEKNARFLTHASALKSSTSAGWKMIFIAGLVLALTLGTIGICISYIARNTAMLHKRELEILNQIGASDHFVARQMQVIVAKISATAAFTGFLGASPILLLILSAAKSARVGLMAMLDISAQGWLLLATLPIIITIFAIWITRRTTLSILKNS